MWLQPDRKSLRPRSPAVVDFSRIYQRATVSLLVFQWVTVSRGKLKPGQREAGSTVTLRSCDFLLKQHVRISPTSAKWEAGKEDPTAAFRLHQLTTPPHPAFAETGNVSQNRPEQRHCNSHQLSPATTTASHPARTQLRASRRRAHRTRAKAWHGEGPLGHSQRSLK